MMLMDVMIQAVDSTWVSCSQGAPQNHIRQKLLCKRLTGGRLRCCLRARVEGKGHGERKVLTFHKGEIARVYREDIRLVATVGICHILVTDNDLSCIPRLLMVT